MRLFVLITTLFFSVSCSFEKDTTLICDCASGRFADENYYGCEIDQNWPLIINESQRKIVWKRIDYTSTSALKRMTRFKDNYIVYDGGDFGKYLSLDRVTLELEYRDDAEKMLIYYQCRVVEGV